MIAKDNSEAAKYYVRHKKGVLPLHYPIDGRCSCGNPDCSSAAKHPIAQLVPNGAKDASIDVEIIGNWWRQYPLANIGLNVGKSRLLVIDIDPAHGGDLRNLPLTRAGAYTTMVRTGGLGWHLYYEAPPNLNISNSNKRCPAGIDIRAGEGAYVVAPPSQHASGRYYQFVRGREPWNLAPQPLPISLLPILTIKDEPVQRTEPINMPVGNHHVYAEKALQNELDRLAQAKEGSRNATLNTAAFSLGQLVGAGLLSRSEVETVLTQAAKSIGLGETETYKTLQSGLEAGINTPRRQLPDLR